MTQNQRESEQKNPKTTKKTKSKSAKKNLQPQKSTNNTTPANTTPHIKIAPKRDTHTKKPLQIRGNEHINTIKVQKGRKPKNNNHRI
jgi:hypothetical protein